jgi:mannitol 2-dehydrogenase
MGATSRTVEAGLRHQRLICSPGGMTPVRLARAPSEGRPTRAAPHFTSPWGTAMLSVSRLRPDVGVPLNDATLPLHANKLTVPTYDRSALVPSVVHIGVGGFHRAHQAMYLDDIASHGLSQEWGVIGVGLRRRGMQEALAPQDCLYTVVERGVGVERGRVVGAICRYLYAREESPQVRAVLADERIRVVTLTITGNGYYLDADSGEFDVECEAAQADRRSIADFETAWGYLADALDTRRRRGIPPFTVVSCDNMADSGDAARKALVTFAGMRDPGLARWISDNVAFPSTMVDRITPKTSQADCELIERRFGVVDRWPVMTEPFSQWIVEDEFCNGRPPLEQVGVEMVADVTDYKLVKTRLLNGVHCAVGYLGVLAGYQRTAEAMADPLIYRYVEHMMRDEIAPLLPSVPRWNIDQYQRILLKRLTNPFIGDQLSRLVARGSMKMPSYLLPSLREARVRRQSHILLTVAVAAWIRYLRGYDFAGNKFTIEDQHAQQLTTMAKLCQNSVGPLLRMNHIFGDLGADGNFVRRVNAVLADIDRVGVQGVLRRNVAASLTDAVAT